MKRVKVPDYKDKNVFGVPLIVHVQRFGQPYLLVSSRLCATSGANASIRLVRVIKSTV